MKQIITFLFILLLCVDCMLPTKANSLPGTEPASMFLDNATENTQNKASSGADSLPVAETISSTPELKTNEATKPENTVVDPGQEQKPVTEPVQPSEQEVVAKADDKSLIKNNHIIAYYGHPNSKAMGILGEHSIEELAARLNQLAAEYNKLNGEKGVIPAFHIIYGTVWPKGEIGIIRKEKLQPYIDFAEQNGWLVFLDHQLGKYSVEHGVSLMLPYLHYKSVHLAIDPEWHTPIPGEELGHVTGADINRGQQTMQEYLEKNNIPDKKMLIVHQFNHRMIRGREAVRSDFSRIDLIHNADGFGSPALKLDSYKMNSKAANMPHKGFKLFYPTRLRDWGTDIPLMKPEEVLRLDPQPVLIMYQ